MNNKNNQFIILFYFICANEISIKLIKSSTTIDNFFERILLKFECTAFWTDIYFGFKWTQIQMNDERKENIFS